MFQLYAHSQYLLFLVAVLLSHSIQRKVKIFIERNFYRRRYDEERRLGDRAVPGEGDRRGARGKDRGRKRRGARIDLPGPAAEGSEGKGANPRTGTFIELPQNRDRHQNRDVAENYR